jgi:hypothetical protein
MAAGHAIRGAWLLAALVAGAVPVGAWAADGEATYALAGTLVLGGKGRCEGVACDVARHRLFLARTDHLQVVDTSGLILAERAAGTRLRGLALARRRAFLADWTGAVQVLGVGDAIEAFPVPLADHAGGGVTGIVGESADDAYAGPLFALAHDRHALVPVAADVSATAAVPGPGVDLPGGPAAAAADGRGHVYVGLDDLDQVAVVDSAARTVTARWPLGAGHHPTGLACDADGRHLFVACADRHLLVLDAAGGAIQGDIPTGAGPGDCAWSAGAALVACADGTLIVARTAGPGGYALAQSLTVPRGGRHFAIDAHGALYLAADLYPAGAGDPGDAPPIADSLRLLIVARLPQL